MAALQNFWQTTFPHTAVLEIVQDNAASLKPVSTMMILSDDRPRQNQPLRVASQVYAKEGAIWKTTGAIPFVGVGEAIKALFHRKLTTLCKPCRHHAAIKPKEHAAEVRQNNGSDGVSTKDFHARFVEFWSRRTARSKLILDQESSKMRTLAAAWSALRCTLSPFSRRPLPKEKRKEASDLTLSPTNSEDVESGDQALQEAYLRGRVEDIDRRSFDWNEIPNNEVIATGRTIRKMAAWNNVSSLHWPALREFLQNTQDHLQLLVEGRLNPALNIVRTNGNVIRFFCGEELICVISTPSNNELHIEQRYTLPLSPRALETGVCDTTKSSNDTAGGFGDGFKTAIVALLAEDPKGSIQWTFETDCGTTISWSFGSKTREAMGTFAQCQLLQVHVRRSEVPAFDLEGKQRGPNNNNTMRQVYKVKGIGAAFWREAFPRLQIFWKLNHGLLLAGTTEIRAFVGLSQEHTLVGGRNARSAHPRSGVYVRGIWVRPAYLEGTIMCFSSLNVRGRDRNDVCDDDVVKAVANILCSCTNAQLLRVLLEPLRGESSFMHTPSSWLVKGGKPNHFMDKVLYSRRDEILLHVFDIPKGALFVSRQTTESTRPFIKWAAGFLQDRGAPLVPITKGAHKYLFPEVQESGLKQRVVELLNEDLKHNPQRSNPESSAVEAIIRFITGDSIQNPVVVLSKEVPLVLAHTYQVFVPKTELDRKLLGKIVSTCHSHRGGRDNDICWSLMEAIFEVLPPSGGLSTGDLQAVLKRAKEILKEKREENRQEFTSDTTKKGNVTDGLSLGHKDTSAGPEPPPGFGKDTSSSKLAGEHDRKHNLQMDDTVLAGKKGREGDISNDDSSRSADPPMMGKDARAVLIARANKESKTTQKSETKQSTSFSLVNSRALKRCVSSPHEILLRRIDQRRSLAQETPALSLTIPGRQFCEDDAGESSNIPPRKAMVSVAVGKDLGGGSLLCIAQVVSEIYVASWSSLKCQKLLELREMMDRTLAEIENSIPSLSFALSCVRHGYDSDNTQYRGFCDGKQIVVNLCAFMDHSTESPELPYDILLTVLHELAHFIVGNEFGHGPIWRDAHDRLISMVMSKSSTMFAAGK